MASNCDADAPPDQNRRRGRDLSAGELPRIGDRTTGVVCVMHIAMSLDWARCVALFSAALGAGGTVSLYLGSYVTPPYQGGPFGTAAGNQKNAEIREKHPIMLRRQRVGLVLLCLSFVTQAVAVLLS